jgi:hypothetical protein
LNVSRANWDVHLAKYRRESRALSALIRDLTTGIEIPRSLSLTRRPVGDLPGLENEEGDEDDLGGVTVWECLEDPRMLEWRPDD